MALERASSLWIGGVSYFNFIERDHFKEMYVSLPCAILIDFAGLVNS